MHTVQMPEERCQTACRSSRTDLTCFSFYVSLVSVIVSVTYSIVCFHNPIKASPTLRTHYISRTNKRYVWSLERKYSGICFNKPQKFTLIANTYSSIPTFGKLKWIFMHAEFTEQEKTQHLRSVCLININEQLITNNKH